MLGIASLGMDREALKGHLDMLILATVEAEPLHGYAVIERLRRRSTGAFDLPEGTVYPVLHRLEHRGLLASSWTRDARRRRVYRVTPAGRRALAQQEKDWSRFARAVTAVVGGTS